MTADFVTLTIINVLFFLIGFIVGSWDHGLEGEIQTIAQNVTTKAKAVTTPDIPVGPVKRPSAQELYLKSQPKQVKDSKEAVEESLDQIPELVEAKEFVAAKKAAGEWIP